MSTTATARIAQFDEHDVKLQGAPLVESGATLFSQSLRPRGFDDSRLQAITSRRAGRKNAASVSEKEVEALLDERRDLLAKKFDGTINPAEERRLNYVRWSLDRIEDARHGETLDELELAVARYENLGEEIKHLISQLQEYAPKGKRR